MEIFLELSIISTAGNIIIIKVIPAFIGVFSSSRTSSLFLGFINVAIEISQSRKFSLRIKNVNTIIKQIRIKVFIFK
jgi:hypothetical protein